MDCKEFNGLIQDFLHDRLDEMKLSEFLSHIEECEDCRDELRIQYLIYEGLERLEAGATFDVDKDLADLMELQSKKAALKAGDQDDSDRFGDHDDSGFYHRPVCGAFLSIGAA